MSCAGQSRAPLPEASGTDSLEARIKRFESAWRQGPPPAIDEFLPTEPSERHELLLELVHIDLEMRLKRGEAARVESYLSRYPALAEDSTFVVELLAEEVGYRVRNEPLLRADEYFHRFPQFEAELRKKLPAHATVGRHAGDAGITPSITPTTAALGRLPALRRADRIGRGGARSRRSLARAATSRSACSRKKHGRGATRPLSRECCPISRCWKSWAKGASAPSGKPATRSSIGLWHLSFPAAGSFSAQEVEQFFREARAAARLRHPYIVSVHEVGRDGSVVYIVSDFIDGQPLDARIRDSRLSPRAAVELCVKVADALEHSHRAGVIHRDLKPGNILLDAVGGPHITDFGLARRETGEATMTVEGQILGTPAYMSPEQARRRSSLADGRTDIYSLGVVLFELLTGERPVPR